PSPTTELRSTRIRITVIGRHSGHYARCFHTDMKQLMKRPRLTIIDLAPAGMAVALVGCHGRWGESGTVDRTFSVNGPVRLELANGAGDSKVAVGSPGEVRIHAE